MLAGVAARVVAGGAKAFGQTDGGRVRGVDVADDCRKRAGAESPVAQRRRGLGGIACAFVGGVEDHPAEFGFGEFRSGAKRDLADGLVAVADDEAAHAAKVPLRDVVTEPGPGGLARGDRPSTAHGVR